jgi:hypothetical protein
MIFADRGTTVWDGTLTGVAPYLTSMYGQYDNGSIIFPYYQRFGGLSALPSGWSKYGTPTITYASSYIKISCSTSSTSSPQGIYLSPLPSSLSSMQTIWEFYGNIYNDSPSNDGYIGTSNSSISGGYMFDVIYDSDFNAEDVHFSGLSLPSIISTNYLYTVQMNSSTSVNIFFNYLKVASSTSITAYSINIFILSGNGWQNAQAQVMATSPQYIYFLRTRSYIPSMPTIQF